MYKLIADSGSTKTDWVLIDQLGKIETQLHTIGFNPYFHSEEFISEKISREFSELAIDIAQIKEVFYYGAGCSSKDKKLIIKKALEANFAAASVEVNHDLIAAARATLGNKDGISCILGTGANSCLWKQGKEIENISSHGYIFGDEGSGSYLGIRLLKLYLSDNLEPNLKQQFDSEFNLTKEEILNKTYQEKNPNVFLANFAKFYFKNVKNETLKNIIRQGFVDFFEVRVIAYPDYKNYELGFVGSIAFYYREILAKVAEEFEMKIYKITKAPIDELVAFHS